MAADNKLLGLECKTRSSSWRASSRSSKTTMEGHVHTKKKQSPKSRVQSSLKKEILQLEKWLQDQFMVQRELEKVLGHRFSSHEISNENSLPKVLPLFKTFRQLRRKKKGLSK